MCYDCRFLRVTSYLILTKMFCKLHLLAISISRFVATLVVRCVRLIGLQYLYQLSLHLGPLACIDHGPRCIHCLDRYAALESTVLVKHGCRGSRIHRHAVCACISNVCWENTRRRNGVGYGDGVGRRHGSSPRSPARWGAS